jgi:hypothetical protein
MRLAFTVSLLCVFACGDDAPPGGPDASTDECTRDEECSDGIFCGGLERCVEGTCEAGATPCPPPLLCDEAADRCQSPGCDVANDADGDGHDALACGGDDCDDPIVSPATSSAATSSIKTATRAPSVTRTPTTTAS